MKSKVIARTDVENQEVGTETKEFVDKVTSIIESMDCLASFDSLIGSNQSTQKVIVKDFQKKLLQELKAQKGTNGSDWEIEKRSADFKDSYDLYYEVNLDNFDFQVIIELDKNRADQISKKFLSRISHTINFPTIYIAFCYPGTERMNINECKKYFGYCSNIMNKMNDSLTPKIFIGMTTETTVANHV